MTDISAERLLAIIGLFSIILSRAIDFLRWKSENVAKNWFNGRNVVVHNFPQQDSLEKALRRKLSIAKSAVRIACFSL